MSDTTWGDPLFEMDGPGADDGTGTVTQWLPGGLIRIYGFKRDAAGTHIVSWEDVKRWDPQRGDWDCLDNVAMPETITHIVGKVSFNFGDG